MPKLTPPTREEKLARREALAARVAEGRLPLPGGVKSIRQALGLSQQQFGERFGLTRQQVIDLEHGRGNPTFETLARIGKPFGFVIGFIARQPEPEH